MTPLLFKKQRGTKEPLDKNETLERVTDFIFLGLQNHCRWWLQPWNEKTLAPWKKSYDNLEFSSAVQLWMTQRPMELAPGACSNSCPWRWWCHPSISSSIIPFSFCPQSFPASGSFPTIQFFTPGDQNIGVSASASVLPINIQDWFPLGWTVGSPCSPRDSQESSPTPQFKSINSALSFLYSPTHIHTWPLEKP